MYGGQEIRAKLLSRNQEPPLPPTREWFGGRVSNSLTPSDLTRDENTSLGPRPAVAAGPYYIRRCRTEYPAQPSPAQPCLDARALLEDGMTKKHGKSYLGRYPGLWDPNLASSQASPKGPRHGY